MKILDFSLTALILTKIIHFTGQNTRSAMRSALKFQNVPH